MPGAITPTYRNPEVPRVEPNSAKSRSDESLVAAVKHGDPEAFCALMERHKRGITSYLYRRLGDRDWAQPEYLGPDNDT